MMPTVGTLPATASPHEAEQCYRQDPLVVEEQFIHGELRYLALGETGAGRRLAFVFTIRGAQVRFVTAYAMTPNSRKSTRTVSSMAQQLIPKFATEEEEAAWWDAHPEVLTERFETARQRGQVRRLSQTNLPGTSETLTIRIPPEELTRARALAAKRGLRYQTYLKMLLHEALDAEEKRLAS